MPKGGFRQSARFENWKAVRYGVNSKVQLFDISKDPQESKNLASENSELVAKMTKMINNRSEDKVFPNGGVIQTYRPTDRFKKEKEQK